MPVQFLKNNNKILVTAFLCLSPWVSAADLDGSPDGSRETSEMSEAIETMQRSDQSLLTPPKPDCNPDPQQCLSLQVPPRQTFCPRDLEKHSPIQSIITQQVQKISTQLKADGAGSPLLACSLQGFKPLRALPAKEETKQRAILARVFYPHLARSSQHTLQVFKKLGELQRYAPDSDPALALVIAERESGHSGYQAGNETIDTFKSGGMDFLGEYLGRMSNSIPANYRGKWKSAEHKRTNMAGHSGRPGLIPRNDLVLAYGSFIHWRYSNFQRAAKKLGVKPETLKTLSPFARKAWQAIFFASDAGLECVKPRMPGGKCELPSGGFGGMTALTYLIKNGHSLEDILTNPELAKYKRARMAVEAARRSIALENLLGMKCPSI